MTTFIRWRTDRGKGRTPAVATARTLAGISFVEAALVVAMVAAATGMARGWG